MNEPKVKSLSELPREIPPPHDGWPALEARLRESRRAPAEAGLEEHRALAPARRRRPAPGQIAALAAVLAAVVVGISIDRWILSPAGRSVPVRVAQDDRPAPEGTAVVYLNDPAYLRERAALLRSLNAQLARLPPPTRKKVLQSLSTLQQSIQQIQQALGREPGNALLQELLIDTYQDEMQVLSTVQDASGGGGEI
jgi:hypothetical protein